MAETPCRYRFIRGVRFLGYHVDLLYVPVVSMLTFREVIAVAVRRSNTKIAYTFIIAATERYDKVGLRQLYYLFALYDETA